MEKFLKISAVILLVVAGVSAQITISNAVELKGFRDAVNNGNSHYGIIVTLTADINLDGDEDNQWTPIANRNNRFRGTFDGDGFVISGIFINNSLSQDYQGLFGQSEGTIKNLGVEVDIKANTEGVGGIAGRNRGIIHNSYAVGSVTGEDWDVGGLVGSNGGRIEYSYAAVTVEGVSYVGGLTGSNWGIIENSYSVGDVLGKEFVGGLAGENRSGKISNSYSVGSVTGEEFVGGLVGLNSAFSTISDSYALSGVEDIDVLVGFNIGEIFGNTVLKPKEEMVLQNTFATWNFVNIWEIDPAINNGFPHLHSFNNSGESSIVRNSATSRAASTASFAGIQNGQINLNLRAGNYTVLLYNLQGRIVSSVEINALNGINTTGLKIDNLARGLFVLNVKQANVTVLNHKIAVR
jgi:hypothetical protein